jgi:hypothetical protein
MSARAVTLEDLLSEILAIRDIIEEKLGRAGPIAVSASDAARLLSIGRGEIYKLHHTGVLNGFRPYPKAHLKFLVSEIAEVAKQMCDERRNA